MKFAKYFYVGGMVLSVSVFCACMLGARRANDRAVEKLRNRLVSKQFIEIYNDSSEITHAQITRDEFVSRMTAMTSLITDIDEDLNWHRDERDSTEPAVYYDENWSALVLEKNGRRVDIGLDWSGGFHLCGISISGDIPQKGVGIFRNCD
jgi:hypothetical protein